MRIKNIKRVRESSVEHKWGHKDTLGGNYRVQNEIERSHHGRRKKLV